MVKLFGILICSISLILMQGHVLYDNVNDKQSSANSAINFIKIGLQQYNKEIEQMVLTKFEEIEDNIEKKLKNLIGTTTKSTIDEEMVTKSDTTDDLKAIKTKAEKKDSQENRLNLITTEYRSNGNLNRIELTNLLKFINESVYTMQIEQRLFKQEMISVVSNMFWSIGNISDILFTIQNDQILLRQNMVSVTTNLSEKVDLLLNNQEISSLEKACNGQFQKQKTANDSTINSTFYTANQTSSFCQKELKEEFKDIETNLRKLFNDGIDNLAFVFGNKIAENDIIFDEIRNSSLYVAEQLSSGEPIHVLRFLEKIAHLQNTEVYNCADILRKSPETRGNDGVYNIMDLNEIKAVYCEMSTDNGGWTVIQRRVNGSVDFYRNWTEYKNGFGFADYEYWIGNDLLHTISSVQPQELRVDMERFNGEKLYAVYSNFSVGNETSKYKLEMNGYSGNAGDSLNYHNNMKFSTPDQDNDNSSVNCATTYRAAWWFNWCIHANPNGLYVHSEKADPSYVTWFNYNASWISMKTMQLMIRSRA